jgi:hypothetical protein
LTAFHDQCWGHPLDHALTTLPNDEEFQNSGVLPGDPFLNIFNKTILVRAEYIQVFDMVKAISNEKLEMAVVTGHPGIGTTIPAIYFQG